MTRLIRYLLENRPARERIAEAGYRHLLDRSHLPPPGRATPRIWSRRYVSGQGRSAAPPLCTWLHPGSARNLP